MEKIIKEKMQFYTLYRAIDGTEFKNENECLNYEDTAKCVLLARYNKLVRKSISEFSIFGSGNEEYMIDILNPLKDNNDVDCIFQLIRLYTSKFKKDPGSEYYSNIRESLEKYLDSKDILLIGRGTEGLDEFWLYPTLQELINTIKK